MGDLKIVGDGLTLETAHASGIVVTVNGENTTNESLLNKTFEVFVKPISGSKDNNTQYIKVKILRVFNHSYKVNFFNTKINDWEKVNSIVGSSDITFKEEI